MPYNMQGRRGLYSLIIHLNQKLKDYNEEFERKTIKKKLPEFITKEVIINSEEYVEYFLNQTLTIEEGGILTLNEGVIIRSKYDKENPVYIRVKRGGRLNVFGNDKDPVILTSQDNMPGAWGGIIICGDGIVRRNDNGLKIINNLTGHDSSLSYGGEDDNTLSCNLNFLVIENAGFVRGGTTFAALSLYGVGYQSNFDNIAIINSGSHGVEIRGGLFNMRRLFIKDCKGNSLDVSQGFGGKFIQTVIYHDLPGFKSAVYLNTNNIIDRHFAIDGQDHDIIFRNLTCVSKVGQNALIFDLQTGVFIDGISLLGYNTSMLYKKDVNGNIEETLVGNFLAHKPGLTFDKIKFPHSIILNTIPPYPLQDPRKPDPNIIKEFESFELDSIKKSGALIENWAINYFT